MAKIVLGWKHKKLGFGLHVPEGLVLVNGTASVIGSMRSPTYNLHILGFFFLCLDRFCANESHHTQHISVLCNLVPCARNPGTRNTVGSKVLKIAHKVAKSKYFVNI